MRDSKGRFTKGSSGSKDGRPGPRKPVTKARAWRRAIEKDAGELDQVERVILDQIEGLMVKSYEGTISNDDRFRLIRVLQEWKKARPVKKQSFMEKWQAKQAAKKTA